MKVKCIAKLLLTTAFVLLCVSAVSADGLNPDSEKYEKYTEKVILSMKDEGYSSSTDYEITSIYRCIKFTHTMNRIP